MAIPEGFTRLASIQRWNSGHAADVLETVATRTTTIMGVTTCEGWMRGEEESCR